ncbi:MAG TPA: hypothetical protein VIH42_10575 [Thermoguttaceae bacterium]
MSGTCAVDPRPTTKTEQVQKSDLPFPPSTNSDQTIKIPAWDPGIIVKPDSSMEEQEEQTDINKPKSHNPGGEP